MEGRKFTGICWAGNFQFRKRWLPSGTSQLAPLFRGQISELFLPFSPVCWQVKGRIKLLPSKPLTWGSMAGPRYNIERNCEFKPKVTQRHGSIRFFLLSIRHKNLFRQLFHTHTITMGLSCGNFFYSGTYTLQTLTPWKFNLARALTKQMLLCIPSLFAFSSIKPNQCFLLKSTHPSGTQKSEAPSFSPCSASLQPPPISTWRTKPHKLSLCYFWWMGEDTSKHLNVKPVHTVIPAEVLWCKLLVSECFTRMLPSSLGSSLSLNWTTLRAGTVFPFTLLFSGSHNHNLKTIQLNATSDKEELHFTAGMTSLC